MEIKIGEKYVIAADKYNWILQERKFKDPNHPMTKETTPDEKLVDIGYYGKLEHLCNSLLNKDLKQSECNTIQELLNKLESWENEVKKAVEGLERVV